MVKEKRIIKLGAKLSHVKAWCLSVLSPKEDAGCTGLPCGTGLTTFTTICSRKHCVALSDDDIGSKNLVTQLVSESSRMHADRTTRELEEMTK